MRENNRNSIEKSRKKLPQFTTMNVIDGQAGLISYTSLIFYSLTIDNILNIIVLLILAGVTISTLTGENGIIGEASNSKIQTEISQEREIVDTASIIAMGKHKYGEITKENLDKELDKNPGSGKYSSEIVEEGIAVTFTESKRTYLVEENGNVTEYEIKKPVDQPETGGNTFTRTVGTTDIVFLTGTSYQEGQANAPELDENTMIPIKWNGSKWVVCSTRAGDWYNYDTTNKQWANVMLSDGTYKARSVTEGQVIEEEDLGSMFVWIPRYAYKIYYFNTQEDKEAFTANRNDKTKVIGYSDCRGIVDANGKVPSDITEEQITSIAVGDNYRPHPAFEKDTSKGGWGKKTKGIWVGKFQTTTTKSSNNTHMILPNKASQRSLDVATIFSRAQEIGIALNMTLDSHMMKNSEWGATVYLAESQYGRNGTEITINNSIITGNAGDTVSANSASGTNAYSTEKGQLASTTGNIYGIYDMSGGVVEYVMGFYKESNGNIHTGYTTSSNSGFNGYLSDGTEYTSGVNLPEEKYYQTYTSNNSNVLGDAIYETKRWNSDDAVFATSSAPAFGRGGYSLNASSSGGFSFNYRKGDSDSIFGFRVSLAVK